MRTPPGPGFGHLLDRATQLWPDRTALIDNAGSLSFAEADLQAARLAVAFAEAGGKPGARVAIILPNSIPFIIAELAVLRLAMVKVPLNIRFHINEVLYALGDAEPTILVCNAAYAASVVAARSDLPSLRAIFVVGGNVEGCLSYDSAVTAGPGAIGWTRYGDDDPILIRYTGGTTGQPKGIVHTHRSFVDIHLDQLRELAFDEHDVALHLGHLSHGLNFSWGAYSMAGATQILRERFDAKQVICDLATYRVSRIYMVPTMIQRLLQEDDGSADVSSLRTFMYASAPMPLPVLRRAVARYGNIFTQVYTLSESPVITTIMRPNEHVDVQSSVGHRLTSCGREIMTMEIRLLDDVGVQVAPGEVGEIVVRSGNNMAQYWKLSEETAATLVDGWIHTGDMARRDEHGFLYLVDRKKDVIITGGFNVYPKEVEDVLYRHPAVAQAAVVGVPDTEWGEAIKAFVVLHPGRSVSEQALVQLCRNNLASYKKPKYVVFTDHLPLSPVGKIMRRALRDVPAKA
jgi:long-chain acyl-CoA synthetase